jgi:hypothetical protein
LHQKCPYPQKMIETYSGGDDLLCHSRPAIDGWERA